MSGVAPSGRRARHQSRRWHRAEEPAGCGNRTWPVSCGPLAPRFGTVTLPPRQRPPGAVEIRRPVGPAFDPHSVAGPQPRPSPVDELLCRGHQQLADAGWRGSGPPPRWRGQAGRPARWHTRARGPARPCRPGPASRAAGPEASRPRRPWCGRPPASSSRPRSRSTRPVTHRVGAVRVALRKLVSSRPSAATPSRRAGSSTSGVP